eukprot:scaffold44955_cov21-Tisochrysis_lutea.AAC.1
MPSFKFCTLPCSVHILLPTAAGQGGGVSARGREQCSLNAAFCSQPVAMNGAAPMVMMAKQAEKAGYKVARMELLANGAPPFIACELCRQVVHKGAKKLCMLPAYRFSTRVGYEG